MTVHDTPYEPVPPAKYALMRRRSRLVTALSVTMIVMYFGFMGLFAFDKPLLGTVLAPGLTFCLLLGPVLILASCLISVGYVRWANFVFDPAVRRLSQGLSAPAPETSHDR